MNKVLSLLGKLHHKYAYEPRIEKLVSIFSEKIFDHESVLDVGCGNGILGYALTEKLSGLHVEGLETHPRGGEPIPVHKYNGKKIPFGNNSFDVVVIADVLHHVEKPILMLQECARVAKRLVIVKDHLRKGVISYLRICLLDWAANAPHGVPCLYRYWSREEWMQMFKEAGLQVNSIVTSLKLYHWSLNPIFGGDIHLVAFTKPFDKL